MFRSVSKIVTILVVLLLSVMSVPAPSGAEKDGGVKNVIFIILDALRADHLGIYGYHRNTSPNIDRLARKGIVFDRAIVQAGGTKRSISSYFTSTYPGVHRVMELADRFCDNLPTMAEIFRNNGYFTFGLVNNVHIGANFGFDKGFEVYRQLHDDEIIEALAFALEEGSPASSVFDEQSRDLFTAFLRQTAAGINLVSDPGFEGDRKNWIWQRDWLSESEPHSGETSLHIAKGSPLTPDNFWYLRQALKLSGGSYYIFGAFVKTRGLRDSVCVRIYEPGKKTCASTDSLSGDNDWTLLIGLFRPETAGGDDYRAPVEIRPVRMENFQEGEVWVDDVFVIPLEYFPPFPSAKKLPAFLSVLETGGVNLLDDTGSGEVSQVVSIDRNRAYIFGVIARTEGITGELYSELEWEGGRCRTNTLRGDNNRTLLLGACKLPADDKAGKKEKTAEVRFRPIVTDDLISGAFEVDQAFLLPVTRDLRRAIYRQAEKLFFYLHFIDPHYPYLPPRRYLDHFSRDGQATLADRYDGEILALDDLLGLLFERLERQDILNESLIVITADHGEAFGEHGKWNHYWDIFYDECARVPLIVYGPSVLPSPRRVSAAVQASVDSLPSLIDLLGLKVPPGTAFQGSSYFKPAAERPPHAFFYESFVPRMVTDHRWKYVGNDYRIDLDEVEIGGKFLGGNGTEIAIRFPERVEKIVARTEEDLRQAAAFQNLDPSIQEEALNVLRISTGRRPLLFDLENDPGEEKNVAELFPEKAAEYEKIIQERIAADRIFRGRSGVSTGGKEELTDELRKKFRALGYL